MLYLRFPKDNGMNNKGMRYYKLTDMLNNGEIIRDDNEYSYRYYFGVEKWAKTGIMIRYQWPNDEFFGEYTEVPESEAIRLMDMQREKLNELYLLAKEIATEAHKGQLDKGGRPYINHPLEVADFLESTEHKIVALLHDVLEDTEVTADDLKVYGFTDRIINSVSILTKDDSMSYEDYLSYVKTDSSAWMVKMADLRHNMDISRIPDLSEKDIERIEKYKKALGFLEDCEIKL